MPHGRHHHKQREQEQHRFDVDARAQQVFAIAQVDEQRDCDPQPAHKVGADAALRWQQRPEKQHGHEKQRRGNETSTVEADASIHAPHDRHRQARGQRVAFDAALRSHKSNDQRQKSQQRKDGGRGRVPQVVDKRHAPAAQKQNGREVADGCGCAAQVAGDQEHTQQPRHIALWKAHQLEQDVQDRQDEQQRREVVHQPADQIHPDGKVDQQAARLRLAESRDADREQTKQAGRGEDLGQQAQANQQDEHVPRELGHQLMRRAEPQQRHQQTRQRGPSDHNHHAQAGNGGLRDQGQDQQRCQGSLRCAHTILAKSCRGTSTSQRG